MTPTTDALTTALNAENAAIFAYGVVAAYASPSRAAAITDAITEHRANRQALTDAFNGTGVPAPLAAIGYNLPQKVTDPTSALQVALAAETECATAYRALLEMTDRPTDRQLSVPALTGCATRAANWRLALKISPATVALPGSGD